MELNQDHLAARQILSKLSKGNLAPEAIRSDMTIAQELGIDSLNFIRLVLEVEAQVGRKLFDIQSIASIVTVGDLYKILNKSSE